MSDEYTPTTEEVRTDYTLANMETGVDDARPIRASFGRWLNSIKALYWAEGHYRGLRDGSFDLEPADNPYDPEWPKVDVRNGAPPDSDAETFIQWKGTDVCMDFHCPCGNSSHLDGEFAYSVRCPHCGRTFNLGTQVRAIETDDPQGEPKHMDP